MPQKPRWFASGAFEVQTFSFLDMAQSFRSQTINVTLPAGTGPGQYNFPEVLDSEYSRAIGVTAYVNSNGGISFFQMGIQDDTATYASLANSKLYEAGIDCPKPAHLTPVNIRTNGAKVTVMVKVPTVLVDELNVDMVFTLERNDSGR